MNTGTKITGREVAVAVAVGIDLREIGTVVKKKIIVIELGASVEVPITGKTVVGAGVVAVVLMEAPLLSDVAPVPRGAHPHAGHLLLGAEVPPMDEIRMNAPQSPKAFHLEAGLLILELHLPVILMSTHKGV